MTLYNVGATVAELIDAETPDAACAVLRDKLRGIGLDPYDTDAFVSEDQPSDSNTDKE